MLCCARTRVDFAANERIRALLPGTLDWAYIYQLAKRHSVLSLFYWRLREAAPDAIPAAQLKKFRENYRDNAARNLFLAGELVRIIKKFEDAGVEAIPYKGPALAITAYGNLSLRRFVDLDIMVRKKDVARAMELLEDGGYEPQLRLTDSQQALLLRTQHNFPFTREGGRLIVELHWEVAARQYASSLSAEDLWGRLQRMTINNTKVKTLSVEDLLLSLCVHGSKHLWERLAWICDVAELINSQQVDWTWLVRRATEARHERMLLLGLRLSHELLDAPLPDELRDAAYSEREVASLAAQVYARLFENEYRPAGLLENLRFNLRARKKMADKVRYLSFVVTPTDGDLAVVNLPSKLSFLYYLLRPVRLLLKGSVEH
ncbi:MAG: nucleotidyltransferase family protein [Pyrinomonadaceae bacterium]